MSEMEQRLESAGWELVRRVEWLEHRLAQVTDERDHARALACTFAANLPYTDRCGDAAFVVEGLGSVGVFDGPEAA